MKFFYLILGLYLIVAAIGQGSGWLGIGIFIFGFMAGAGFEFDMHHCSRSGEDCGHG